MHSSERSLIAGGGVGMGSGAAAKCGVARARRALQRAGASRGLLLGGCGGTAASAMLASAHMSPSQGAQDASRPRRKRGPLDFGSSLRRCTDALLVANAVAFAAQWLTRDALTLWGAKVNALVAAGQWWRLLTSSLLHTSLFHLLINSHALHTIGPHLEMVGGRARFVAVYVTGALVGTTASFLLTPAPSVGASAALFGVGAALGVFYWRHRDLLGERSDSVLRQLGVTLAVNLAYSLANRRVDNWGHIGGMLGGAAVAALLGPSLVRDEATGRVHDRPPLPLLAYSSGAAGTLGHRRPKAPAEAASDKAPRGKGKGKGKKLPRRPDGDDTAADRP